MIISVASGKGGTGKTFIATNLASVLSRLDAKVTYVDADVEEPNGHLFLHPDITRRKAATARVPFLCADTCSGCGNCQSICAFNAIMNIGKSVTVFNELCHGCGACILACRDNYLCLHYRDIGIIEHGITSGPGFCAGTLHMGEARSTPVIQQVMVQAQKYNAPDSYVIVDAPPGTSCAAMAAVESADLVVMVTEPTALGLHDLKLAVEMTKALGRPMVAVLNRADLGTAETASYLNQQQIPLWAEIPFSESVAHMGTEGKLAVQHDSRLESRFLEIAKSLSRHKDDQK